MFVELLRALLIGSDWRPAGAVVEVDKPRGSRLIARGDAIESGGPELLEPFPAPQPSGPAKPRAADVETAAGPPAEVERTVSRKRPRK